MPWKNNDEFRTCAHSSIKEYRKINPRNPKAWRMAGCVARGTGSSFGFWGTEFYLKACVMTEMIKEVGAFEMPSL